jgi:aspartate kinase
VTSQSASHSTSVFPHLIVQKYGGTSVGSPEKIRAVAARIARTRQLGHPMVVVVSAMGHTTDELLSLAQQVSQNPPHREIDMLLSTGERISMALLSMALADLGVPAISLTGSQSGIITDQSHRRARILEIRGDRISSGLEQGKVVIVAGFQGVSRDKEITTLGRGGSDTTAVAIAAAFGASACEIYTDVDGVYSADPRWVKEARLYADLDSRHMVELAVLGAGVLHPRSVQLAAQHQVPLWVKNSHSEVHLGTQIQWGSTTRGVEEFSVVGVTSDSSRVEVRIELARESLLESLWSMTQSHHWSMIGVRSWGAQVQFWIEKEFSGEWHAELNRMASDGYLKKFEIIENCVPLSIVGSRLTQDGRALFESVNALRENGIEVSSTLASSHSITLGIRGSQSQEAIQVLHRLWIEQ